MVPMLTIGAGAGKYFIELAKNFHKKNVTVECVTLDKEFFNFIGRIIQIYHRFDFTSSVDEVKFETEASISRQLGGAKWIPVSWLGVKKRLVQYDVVYTKNEIIELLFLKFIGYRNLPPVIVGVHTPLYYPVSVDLRSKLHNFLYTGPFYRWLIDGARLVHVSNSSQETLVENKLKAPVKFIYYPFDADGIKKSASGLKTKIKFDDQKYNIAFIARMTEQKGIGELAIVAKKLSEREKLKDKIKLHIFGDGSLNYIADNISDEYQFAEYYGYVPHAEIASILSMQDLFITTAKWETLPFNVLEAQAMGVPVVAFNIPGPSDIIADGKTGFLVEDEGEFVDKVAMLVDKKAKFDKRYIVENIKSKFDPDKVYDDLYKMFLEVL